MSLKFNVLEEMYPKTPFDIQVESVEYEGMLQFLANNWLEASFFTLVSSEQSVWILDSTSVKAKKNKDDYPLSKAIEYCFGSGLTWTMVQCLQQDGSWECGYMVIWYMFQFVLWKRFRFPNSIWTEATTATQE
ncbi:hypothetical protein HanXRQr2_Chr05g0225231 [Helianthus annuus]|uniref:Ubiquitin-like protease family profile domain-containing protein n=1 Tax=Helianthus annuus TaxID=4232 RepID=A0A9K3J1I3_HELAN|nr:hypothetical protein HanXRQr2_Chr05g0225231 [Helianthus annuus]KAJ0585321.1 hypothetical protein HanHA89_Chr05g0199031 [Helianthus annuus]